MSKKPPAFQLYAADFYMDTASWTATQVGIYFRLLMHEWVNGPLPNNMAQLARIAGVDTRNLQKCWSLEIAKKFTPDDAGMLVNKRLEEVRSQQEKYHEVQRLKGISGAEKRWGQDIPGAIPQPQPKDESLSSTPPLIPKEAKSASPSNHFSEAVGEQAQELIAVCRSINSTDFGKKFNPFQYVQKNKHRHPKALIITLQNVARNGPMIKSPWPYADKVLRAEDCKAKEFDNMSLAKSKEASEAEYKAVFEQFFSNIGK